MNMRSSTLKNPAICNCAFERNIFIKDLNKHFTFKSEEQFLTDYGKEFSSDGVLDIKYKDIVKQIKDEITRRKLLGEESEKRKKVILENYRHIHPEILTLQESHLSEELISLTKLATKANTNQQSLIPKLKTEKAPKSYSFKVFKDDFCDKLVEELENFEKSGLPRGKPNTMNNYGVLLSELGYKENFFDPLVSDYLGPIAKILYPEFTGEKLDSHRTFAVSYALGKDTDLSYHYDDAEVTLNVALGKVFEGGELYLGGMQKENGWRDVFFRYCHLKAHGLMHRGQQMHGAMPITEGERYNLIIWMRSSSVRNQRCPMCNEKPDLILAKGEGGGFTIEAVDVCSAL